MRNFLYKIIQFLWIKSLFWTYTKEEPKKTDRAKRHRDIESASQAAKEILDRKFNSRT